MEAPATVDDYDPDWPRQFALIREHIRPALSPGVRVEHVGSTAVPGLPAKPIIDVDVVVPSPQYLASTTAVLVALGYEPRGDLGIPGREAFSVLAGLPYHHLYLVVAGTKPYRDHADLRDYLRAHPEQAQRYGAEKRRLAHLLATDREAYVAAKSGLIEVLLTAARKGVPP